MSGVAGAWTTVYRTSGQGWRLFLGLVSRFQAGLVFIVANLIFLMIGRFLTSLRMHLLRRMICLLGEACPQQQDAQREKEAQSFHSESFSFSFGCD
jgi:hypothetical protein